VLLSSLAARIRALCALEQVRSSVRRGFFYRGECEFVAGLRIKNVASCVYFVSFATPLRPSAREGKNSLGGLRG
jgi:hypothetical protein